MTWKSSSFFSAVRRGSTLLRSEFASSISFCACSRLFQKLSAAIRSLSSPRRFCAPGTSKKPPQMSKLICGSRQFSSDRIEHGAEFRLLMPGLQVDVRVADLLVSKNSADTDGFPKLFSHYFFN